MPTQIRMYDCAFGDCFRISRGTTDDSPHLYVDFGIHNMCRNPGNWKATQYDQIIKDMIPCLPTADFLLSHYHYDHYSGVLKMIENHHKFQNVYIPDIWNNEESKRVVELLLLKDALSKTVLARGHSLLRFLICICKSTGTIYFVSRGSVIQDHYIALSPTEDQIHNAANILPDTLDVANPIPSELSAIADQLQSVMREIAKTNSEDERKDLMGQLEALEESFTEAAEKIRVDANLRRRLGDLKHSINIIFQDRNDKTRHILFTGDADGDDENGASQWDFLRKNSDNKVAMHEKYHVIKIPHHGTGPHYHNFTGFSNSDTIYLITNGMQANWEITDQYSADANKYEVTVCCSRNSECQAANSACSCQKHRLIHPNLYIDL